MEGKSYFAKYWPRSERLLGDHEGLEVKLAHYDVSKDWCEAFGWSGTSRGEGLLR